MHLNNFNSREGKAMIKQELPLFTINYPFVARNLDFKERNYN